VLRAVAAVLVVDDEEGLVRVRLKEDAAAAVGAAVGAAAAVEGGLGLYTDRAMSTGGRTRC
jgi:hypothetical protein